MGKLAGMLIFSLFICLPVHAADEFDKVRCDSEVPIALIGQRINSIDSVAKIESRHTALALKNLGGDDVSDDLFLASWQICGNEFDLLVDNHSVVRDVLKVPQHSSASPFFVGSCEINGKKRDGIVVAILVNDREKKMLRVNAAWQVDDAKAKFTSLVTTDLQCPREGISTVDGGR